MSDKTIKTLCPYWRQVTGDVGGCTASVNNREWICEKLGAMTHDQCAFYGLEKAKEKP